MRFLMLPMILMATMIPTDEWAPPQNPDPSVILKDARAEEYVTVLTKHIWL